MIKKDWIIGLLGVGLGAALLYSVLQKVDTNQILISAHDARPSWILAGMGAYAIDILLRAERWRRLIRPTLKLPYLAVIEALVVGYAFNNILPARLGEVFRADFIARRQRLARSSALGSIAVERIMDAAVVLTIFTVGLLAATSVSEQASGTLTAIAVVAGVGLLTALTLVGVLLRCHARLPSRFVWLGERVAVLARSISSLSIAVVGVAIVLSLVIWFIEATAIACVMRAFGVEMNWAGLCVVVGASSLGALIPSAPGYIGSLQVAFVLAFSALGLAEPLGVLSATAVQIFLLGTITIVGLAMLFASRFYTLKPTEGTLTKPISPISGDRPIER